MKTKILALALAASMAAGAAYAQTSTETTQEGGSNATAEMNDRGTPRLPDESVSGFYTDSTMGTMRTDAELSTMWSGMNADQQAQMKAGCAEEYVSTQRDLPQTYKDVCAKINAM